MFEPLLAGLHMVLQVDVVLTIMLASIYGLVVGALPGLSATMATALLVPVTFYMSPIAAISAIIAASAMAIFSGDIQVVCSVFLAHQRRQHTPTKPLR